MIHLLNKSVHLYFQGLFKPSAFFFTVVLAHIIAFEIAAYSILYYFGTGWIPWISSLACYIIVQVRTDQKIMSAFKCCV